MTIQLANHHMRVPPQEREPFALVLQSYSTFIKEGLYIDILGSSAWAILYPRVRFISEFLYMTACARGCPPERFALWPHAISYCFYVHRME